MVYEVPASKASHKQNQFEFRVPGSKKVHSIPLQQYLTNGLSDPLMAVMARLAPHVGPDGSFEDVPEIEALELATVTKELFEKLAPGVYEKLDQEQTQELIAAWIDASTTDLGKSSAS